jgi:hypothetical protein
MMACFQPALELDARRVRGIGASEPALDETEPPGFRSYCFLKAFVGSHEAPLAGSRRFP